MGVFLILGFLFSQNIWAMPKQFGLGEPSYRGTGCPRNSASIVLSPDESALSILFDRYFVEAGGQTNKRRDRKFCRLNIPLTIPPGKMVSLVSIDYRGFSDAPNDAETQFFADYSFAGKRGKSFSRRYLRKRNQDFFFRDSINFSERKWSRCGKNTNLTIGTSILAKSNQANEPVYAAIDTIDLNAGLVYIFEWKNCSRK